MTKRIPLRRAGAAALGAALIGFGAVRYDLVDWDQEPQPPPDPKPDVPQNPRKLVLPEPKFGWPVGQEVRDPAKDVRDALGKAARERRGRAELLSSTSDHALAPPAPPSATSEDTPALAAAGAGSAAGAVEAQGLSATSSEPEQQAQLGDPLPAPVFGLPLTPEQGGDSGEPQPDAAGPGQLALVTGGEETPPAEQAGLAEPAALAELEPPAEGESPAAAETNAAPPAFAEAEPQDWPQDVVAAAAPDSPPTQLAPAESTSTPIQAQEPIAQTPVETDPVETPPLETSPAETAPVSETLPESQPGTQAGIAPPSMPPAQPTVAPAAGAQVANAPVADNRAPTALAAAAGDPAPVRVASREIPDVEATSTLVNVDSFAAKPGPKSRTNSATNPQSAGLVAPTAEPAPPLAKLVPDRAEAPQRLALASAIPPKAKPGPAETFGSPAQAELDPATALARANERSLLGFSSGPPAFTYEDELIMDVQVKGVDASDTVFAYGTREGIFLPVGTFARILDLALSVSDGGNYASGWTLDEKRTLTLDLRNHIAIVQGEEQALPRDVAAAFDGEMYLRSDLFQRFLPIDLQIDLRRQRITLETLEPFPFQEKARREANREKLAAFQSQQELRWPREETPWRLFSTPLVDLEMRALSDRARGDRVEGDLRMAGDLGFLTAETLLSADTKDGLTASLITLGRTDPDAELLGPLQATSFTFGDVSTVSLPIGLRGVAGRGLTLTNTPPESVSVFENIDLRGVLPDGYEVELYRNDVLIGSTAEAINGQYEFLQVPVDFGLNVLRLVFYGPQGQRSEQVRRITVGDGRLAKGKMVYRFGAAQKDENVLGVRDPFYQPPDDLGAWRLTGELAYGLTTGLTAIASGAWFETPQEDKWLFSSGIRTGIGRFAVRSDVTFGDGGTWALGAGLGGRFGNSTFTLDHTEYSGDFIDETRTIGREFLRRSSELNFNTTLNLGNPVSGLIIPLTARLRHFESQAGRKQTSAAVRASTRISGLLASNTLEYSRTSFPQLNTLSQMFGNFDLSTLGRSKLRGRVSLGYEVLPSPDLVSTSLEASYLPDDRTSLRARLGYSFRDDSTQVGASAVREFDNFTLSLDGNYGFSDKNYSVGLRFATAFGRNPQNGRFFMARPGIASMGAASMRAFQDMDGDGLYGPTDRALPEVDFVAFNQTASTDEDGIALLGGLGNGQRVTLQVDRASLPDIALAPAKGGVEIVPRPGRVHQGDFPIVALSEIEGQVDFVHANGTRGVSGVRLQLRNKAGEVVSHTRSEMDGYYFFEEVKPGQYEVVLDPEQAEKLQLCAAETHKVDVGYESDIYQESFLVSTCE